MKVRKALLFPLICIFLHIGCSIKTRCRDSENKTDSIDRVDYQIYSLALSEVQPNSDFFVLDKLTTKLRSIAEEVDKDYYPQLFKQNFPELSKTVFNDYKKKNSTIVSLENKFEIISKTVKLISKDELDSIFSTQYGGENWSRFYNEFPKSKGLITLSRIGYNSCRTEAVLEISIIKESLNAEGWILLLKKENNSWKINKMVQTWIS
ncbi:MAG TPA: hypothetical protein PLG33_02105 [Prolixibacteraceae bacterium]|nr:hypothetical protein [Prolixibacteraceae bacterium]HPR84813.1 hypothetical protein [Prolixibacteraceae bacterium]